ncbi:MAG: hypothetical protein CO170_01040 [candidate division SR1 bacterium CG_4_9_14_3_um_filter_40_9]|nr:MAG: hypothetical protein CO170_01040 [candidate division SR1 bacterium CG_4_9_14_3_um_filter_40_9]
MDTKQTQIVIDTSNTNQRLDRFLRKFFRSDSSITLGDIYAAIRKGGIKVNGKRAKEEYRIQESDVVVIRKLENKNPKASKDETLSMEDFKKRILYEDNNRLIVDKPYDMVMHTTNPKDIAIQDYLDIYCKKLITPTFTPSFGYRLDKDTTGVLVAAKTMPALQYINKIIRDREISKMYYAIVVGKFPDHMLIDKALEKSFNEKFKRGQTVVNERFGERAVSECWNEKNMTHPILGEISLIKVKIETGKMHQIRAHTASVGYPVLGDIVYGKPVVNRILFKQLDIKRQLLHAYEYKFFDMFGNKTLKIVAPIPKDFQEVMKCKK